MARRTGHTTQLSQRPTTTGPQSGLRELQFKLDQHMNRSIEHAIAKGYLEPSYDGTGKVESIVIWKDSTRNQPIKSESFAYDSSGRVEGTLETWHWANGDSTTMHTTYTYDAAGLMSSESAVIA